MSDDATEYPLFSKDIWFGGAKYPRIFGRGTPKYGEVIFCRLCLQYRHRYRNFCPYSTVTYSTTSPPKKLGNFSREREREKKRRSKTARARFEPAIFHSMHQSPNHSATAVVAASIRLCCQFYRPYPYNTIPLIRTNPGSLTVTYTQLLASKPPSAQ